MSATLLCIGVSCFILILVKVYMKLTAGWCKSQVCLKGKTVIITGANSGIGFETALDLAKRGAKVILACRNEARAIEARDRIIKETNNNDVIYKVVDLSSLESVSDFAKDIISTESSLDILINNAGAGGLADKITEDGLLETMQINYFAPFLLTNLLLSLLVKSSGRIINVSSIAAKYGTVDVNNINKYKSDTDQYLRSKLCLNLFTIELASRLNSVNATAYSLHPGAVRTELFKNMPFLLRKITNTILELFCKSALEGAQTSIHVAVSKDIEKLNGEHFHDCHPVARYSNCDNGELAKQLWAKTAELVELNSILTNFPKFSDKSF